MIRSMTLSHVECILYRYIYIYRITYKILFCLNYYYFYSQLIVRINCAKKKKEVTISLEMTNKLKHNIIYLNIKTLNVTTTIENEKTVDILIFLISFL